MFVKVKCVTKNGNEIVINVDKIIYVEKVENGYALIMEFDNYFIVSEEEYLNIEKLMN